MENLMNLKDACIHEKNKDLKKIVKYLTWALGGVGAACTFNVNADECTTAAATSRFFSGFPLTSCWCGPDNPNRNNLISGVAYIEGSGTPVQVINATSITLGASTQTVVYENTTSTRSPKQQYSCVWNGAKFTSGMLINSPTTPTTPTTPSQLLQMWPSIVNHVQKAQNK